MTSSPFAFLPTGAIIQSFVVGKTNIVQGFPSESQYPIYNSPYFGETIGRVANRIDRGIIQSLNGRSYSLVVNDGPNALHGGPIGWSKKVWEGPEPVGSKPIEGLDGKLEGGESVKFTLKSEDGDEGYPGTVITNVLYTTGTQNSVEGGEVRVLAMEYEVQLVGDEVEETVINLTNHSYVSFLPPFRCYHFLVQRN
jgi:aldose 1-epimerase